jgi:ketosteroid isomerase-like protein
MMAARIRGLDARQRRSSAADLIRSVASRRRLAATVTALLFVLTAGRVGACDLDSDGSKARTDRLHERMALFRAAFAQADVAALEGMLAPNYTHTNDRSAPLPRARWIEGMAKRRAATAAGESTITQFTTDNVTLCVSGDTAVGTGVTIMRGTRNGSPYGLRINFTQVWAWNGEDWYRVAFHDTYEPLKE